MNNINVILLLLGFLIFRHNYTHSQDLKNYDLREQLKEQNRGYLGKNFSIASDIELWKYLGEISGFYHGAGHRIDIFAEYELTEKLQLNLDFFMVNGSISSGYLGNIREETLFGATWNFSDRAKLRFMDLGQITIGSGLFVENAFASGGEYIYEGSDLRVIAHITGTSIISLAGDLYSLAIEKDNSAFKYGFLTYIFTEGRDFESGDSFEPLTGLYLNATNEISAIYNLEFTYNPDEYKYAFLGKLGFKFGNKDNFKVYGQYRKYESFVTQYMTDNFYDYIPLSFMQRNFTNSQNILASVTDVELYSLHFDFNIKINDHITLESSHEYIDLKRNSNNDRKFFFSERLSYSLEEKMNNSYFFTYVTNRTLVNDSIRYDNNIYNEKIIIGAGLKILL